MREIFSIPGEYSSIFRQALSKAHGDVFVFDPSLRDLGLDSGLGYEELHAFFANSPMNRLFIVLQSEKWLLSEAARLPRLLEERSHQAQIRLAGTQAQRVEDCFLLTSGEVVRKAVAAAHSGARFSREDPEYSAYISRWGEIWEESAEGVAFRPLGL